MFHSRKAAFFEALQEELEEEEGLCGQWQNEDRCSSQKKKNPKKSCVATAEKSSSCEFENDEDELSRQKHERRREAMENFIVNASNDLYQTLGVSFSASTAEIRSAFKRLILLSHPDRFASNNQELDFIKIKQAYSILGNEDFRAVYDSQGYQAALLAVEGNTTFSYDM